MVIRIFSVVLCIAIVIHVMAVEVPKPTPHWAYLKPQRPSLPKTNSSWPRNAIDFFILRKLNEQSLKPSSGAAPGQLLRRAHLDLIGLPPTPEVVDQFLSNPSDAAYEKIVDGLLKSPRYGERWARPWLDLARYADSNGFQADQLRDSWAYRDWVIDALNAGMPFNQFVIEQIAGDLLRGAQRPDRFQTVLQGPAAGQDGVVAVGDVADPVDLVSRPPARRLFGVAGPPSGADRDEADSGGGLVRGSLPAHPRLEVPEGIAGGEKTRT